MPRQYERILVAVGITRDPGFLRDFLSNFYVSFAMTLSHLHSRFPTCLCGAFGSRCQSMCWNLWVSILLGFLDLETTCAMWFDILFGTWDYLLSTVGVDHLGSTRSGGSAFYSYHWDPSVDTVAGASWFFLCRILVCWIYLWLCCSMFRCDIPISIVPMISSMTWDVTCGGWLGPTMV